MPPRVSAILLALFFAAMQIAALPPDGFVTGDQGSKFLQARAFADNGPFDPSIDVRARDIDPEYRRQEPKLKNRRGRLVSEFLWLLPLLSAPFFALFGMRGLYVVPALSVLVIFFAAATLGRRLGDERGTWTAWVTVVATPVLMYGLELWEHAPAAACVMVAAALVAGDVGGSQFAVNGSRLAVGGSRLAVGGSQSAVRGSRFAVHGSQFAVYGSRLAVYGWRFAVGGAVIMVGALFREEVIVALAALPIARAVSLGHSSHGGSAPKPPRARSRGPMIPTPLARLTRCRSFAWRDLVTTSVWMALGAVVVFAASVPMNLLIYGSPLPMHVTQDAWEVAKNTPYFQVRRDIVVDLFLPASHGAMFVMAAVAGIAASLIEMRRRRGGAAPSEGLLMVVHACAAVILFIAVVLPVWRLVQGVRPHDAYRVTSAAHTWTFALALLYWPWVASEPYRPIARYLVVSALLLLLGTALIVPTSGGAQWSPRFLLAVAPLLAVVAAAAARLSLRGFRLQAEDPPRAQHQARVRSSRRLVVMTSVVLLASLLMQASSLFYVQRAKARNARLTHWVASRTADGDVLITDVFWFPEVTATLAPSRRMLFSWSGADVPAMAAMAVARGLPRFGVVTSTALTGYDAPPTLDVPGAPCRFVRGQRVNLEETGLLLNRYACEEP